MNEPPLLPKQQQAQTCGLATASLILGICSFACLFVCSIPAIITGHMARSRIRKSTATLTGDGMAVAGLIMGYASMVVFMLIVLLAAAGFGAGIVAMNKAKSITSVANAKALESAINNFYTEYGNMPEVPAKVKTDSGEGVRLLNILLGLEENSGKMQNSRMIQLLQAVETRNKAKGGLLYSANGRVAEGMYDAWGNPFTIEIDVNNGERLRVTLGDKTTTLNGRRVAVYSPGADKKLGTPDDVTSW